MMNKTIRDKFKVGDKVRIIANCSGTKMGQIAIIEFEDNELWARTSTNRCHCQDNWILISRVSRMIEFFLLFFNRRLKNELKLTQLGILKGKDAEDIKRELDRNEIKWRKRIENLALGARIGFIVFSPILGALGVLLAETYGWISFLCYELVLILTIVWAIWRL